MSNPELGFAAQRKSHGQEVMGLGVHHPLSNDLSAQIGKLKDAGVDIITSIFLPPDWTTFWVQAKQSGFTPKAATIAKALLFLSSVEAIGDRRSGTGAVHRNLVVAGASDQIRDHRHQFGRLRSGVHHADGSAMGAAPGLQARAAGSGAGRAEAVDRPHRPGRRGRGDQGH
jgi:hypothetical protein